MKLKEYRDDYCALAQRLVKSCASLHCLAYKRSGQETRQKY